MPHNALPSWLLSFPPVEYGRRRAEDVLLQAVRVGRVPQHMAFIMDGNRRYAKRNKLETLEGHHHGFKALERVLHICYRLGVKHVTVYAFSIDNFRRPRYEVDGLMQLGKAMVSQLAEHSELLGHYGVRLHVGGRRQQLPADVVACFEEAEARTRHNGDAFLHIMAPYTSRDEMTMAIQETVREWAPPPLPPPPPPPQSAPAQQTAVSQKMLSRHAAPTADPAGNNTWAASTSSLSLPTIREAERESSSTEPSPTPSPSLEAQSAASQQAQQASSASSTTTLHSEPARPLSLFAPTGAVAAGQAISRSDKTSRPPTSDGADESIRQQLAAAQATIAAPAPKPAWSMPPLDLPNPESITAETIDRHLYTASAPPVDVLVRTSGVERLSDFLLWQVHQSTHIFWVKTNWPDFSMPQLLFLIFEWQWRQAQRRAE